MAYKITLLFIEIYIFQIVNKAFSKYYRTKKNCIYQGDILVIKEIYNILA